MLRRAIIAVLLFPLVIITGGPGVAGCGSGSGDVCPPDGGCYCGREGEPDVATCHTLGANWTPYCCTGRGGQLIECGQPAACVPKPGILDAGAMGANYCCPQ